MATLKIQTRVLITNCPKTDVSLTIFMICLAGTKMIVYMLTWFSPMTFWWESPSHINNHLCSCKSYHENCWWNISLRAISNQNTYLNFQGCHINGNLATFKLNRKPDQKRNFRFFIFMVKNLRIYILFFRVPKKGMSGMPYLTRGQHNFSKNIFLSILVLFQVTWHKNLTWELNVR